MTAIDTLSPAQCIAFGVVNVRRILAETIKVRGIEFFGWNIITEALDHGWRMARGESVDPQTAVELEQSVRGMGLPVMVRDPEVAIACKAITATCEMMIDPPGAPALAPRVADAMVELISYWYADPTKAAVHERAFQDRLIAHLSTQALPPDVEALLAAVPPPARGLTTAPVATKFGQAWLFGFGAGAADEEEDEEEEEEDGDDEDDDEEGDEEDDDEGDDD